MNDFIGFEFYGETIHTLHDFITLNDNLGLSYNTTIRLIWCLHKQQKILEKYGYGIYNIDLHNIIVVDDFHFFVINPSFIKPINSKGLICFNSPFNKNRFSSPEIKALTCIPSHIHYKTIYYSISLLSLFVFSGNLKYDERNNDNYELIETLLQPIIYTKLYWFFKHSLEIDFVKRKILFI